MSQVSVKWVLSREQVEALADHIAHGRIVGYLNQWRTHDAAQRLAIEKQAGEIERLTSEKNSAVIELYQKLDAKDQHLVAMTAEREKLFTITQVLESRLAKAQRALKGDV